jgi:predicted acetyltransferase
MDELVISEATPEQLGAVAELCGKSFARTTTDCFRRFMELDPQADEATTLVGHVGGDLVATARIFARNIRWGEDTLTAGCIGNVATDPDHRRRGHAAKIMTRTIEVMESRGFEISLLFTDLPRVYEKVGYEVWQQSVWSANASEAVAGEDHRLAVREADQRSDLPSLMQIHNAFDSGHFGPAIRTERHWLSMPAMYPGDDTLALVALAESEIRGHVRVMRESDGRLRVHELSAVDAEAGVAVLGAAAQRCASLGATEISITLPRWPLIRESIGRVFGQTGSTMRMAGMWRALSSGPSPQEIAALAERGEFHFWAGDRF